MPLNVERFGIVRYWRCCWAGWRIGWLTRVMALVGLVHTRTRRYVRLFSPLRQVAEQDGVGGWRERQLSGALRRLSVDGSRRWHCC